MKHYYTCDSQDEANKQEDSLNHLKVTNLKALGKKTTL